MFQSLSNIENKKAQILNIRENVYKLLEENDGIIRLKPTWVARKNFFSGKNLGLNEEEYNLGERGEITERWIGSTTKAANDIGPSDEGLSYIYNENNSLMRLSLEDVINNAGDLILGKDYAKIHKGLKRLIKILDYSDRIFFHYHQGESDAKLVGRNSKEEAYYYPENTSLGFFPVTFFGFHPHIEKKKYDILLPYLVDWNSDLILKHSRGYMQVENDGFHLPAGIPHSPGTALTIELQEDSDVYGNLQALYRGKILSKETLFHDVRKADREKYGERIVLEQLDWEKSTDPFFYENRHTPPIADKKLKQKGVEEYWIFYNTNKFCGKRVIINPGLRYISRENGPYTILVWNGKGTIDSKFIEAKKFNYDEIIVVHEKAIKQLEICNSGKEKLEILKFFGPDIVENIPMLEL